MLASVMVTDLVAVSIANPEVFVPAVCDATAPLILYCLDTSRSGSETLYSQTMIPEFYCSLCRGSKTLRSFSHSTHSCLATSARCTERGSNTAGNSNGPFVICETQSASQVHTHHDFVTRLSAESRVTIVVFEGQAGLGIRLV